jgi:hypothetical protein
VIVAWSELVLTTGSAAMLLPVTGSPPVGANMASSKRPPLGARHREGSPSLAGEDGGRDVIANHRPWLVLASQLTVIGSASCVGVLHAAPPVVDEMKPTSSWQVAAVQAADG